MSADPRREVDEALYELGVLCDVMRAVATDESGARSVCGTTVQWFCKQIDVQNGRIELALNRGEATHLSRSKL